MNKGLIHIYTGDGKGKTTAATGLAYRAKGAGMKVCFLQLFKSGTCNESNFFDQCEFVREELCKFSWEMSKEEITDYGKKALTCIKNIITKDYDIIIIDEFFMLTNLNIITDSEACKIINLKPSKTELVLTGRNAPEKVIEIADYVSEIKCIKHPYDKGIECREGIEF